MKKQENNTFTRIELRKTGELEYVLRHSENSEPRLMVIADAKYLDVDDCYVLMEHRIQHSGPHTKETSTPFGAPSDKAKAAMRMYNYLKKEGEKIAEKSDGLLEDRTKTLS